MAKLQKLTKARITVAVIVGVAVLLLFFDAPVVFNRPVDWLNSKLGTGFPHFKSIPYVLGLDLQGGTELVYEADTSKVDMSGRTDAVSGVRDVIERRINAFGVSEPSIQINKAQGKWRILIQLAGVKDINQAIKMIGETPLLEFKEENTEPERQLTTAEKQSMAKYNADAKTKANKALQIALSGTNFGDVVKQYTENDVGKETGGAVGWIRENSSNVDFFSKANAAGSGKIVPNLVERPDGYYVLKVNDRRDNEQEIQASHILICYAGADNCGKTTTKEEALQQTIDLKAKATPQNFAQLARENSTEPNASSSAGNLDWFSKGTMVQAFEDAAFKLAKGQISDVVETSFGYHLIYKADERALVEYSVSEIYIAKKQESDILPPKDAWKSTGLTGSQLQSAAVEFDQRTNTPQVALTFNDAGAKLFAEITGRNVGKPVAIYLDGQPISVPTVNEAITGGQAVITGKFNITEAKTLAQRLNAGALPIPITLVSQQNVGATLGAESLQKSLFAGLIGLILVALFMIVYYRLPGLLATFALLVYGILSLFLFKLIPVTMTLAGIAGFILSVGMAVDANILIFARMKEELALGKPLGSATNDGFKRAWPAIRDGHITTLITCIILAWFATSSIKGFAITLGIGVLLSLFSSMVITREFMLLFVNPQKEFKKMWLFFGRPKKNDSELKQ
ncbi:MAG: protein translocase subunit SecD [Parcubacteria group bacterium]